MRVSYRSLISLLEESGFSAIPHSSGTLLAHLIGTYDILKRWRAAQATCMAGLFHAIYGTQSNNESKPPEPVIRKAIQEVLGEQAEKLVWLFSIMDKQEYYRGLVADSVPPLTVIDRFQQTTIALDRPIKEALVQLLAANWLEVIPRDDHAGALAHTAPLLLMAKELDTSAAAEIFQALALKTQQ